MGSAHRIRTIRIFRLPRNERAVRLEPENRPALRVADILRILEREQVEFVLAGSLVPALYGARIVPNDVDIVPRLDPENLERLAAALTCLDAVPAYIDGWTPGLSRDECEAWRPKPPTEKNLDHLFVTPHGMLDVVPRLAGRYDDLRVNAALLDVHGCTVRVCSPHDVLSRIEAAGRPKDVERLAEYRSALEERCHTSGTFSRPFPHDKKP